MNSVFERGLLSLFQSFYKNFKGQFIEVRPLIGDLTLLDGFPLYWSTNPRFQSARRLEDLDPRERGVCDFLKNLKVVFDTSMILTKEFRAGSLKAYIGISPLFSPICLVKTCWFALLMLLVLVTFAKKMLSYVSKVELVE